MKPETLKARTKNEILFFRAMNTLTNMGVKWRLVSRDQKCLQVIYKDRLVNVYPVSKKWQNPGTHNRGTFENFEEFINEWKNGESV